MSLIDETILSNTVVTPESLKFIAQLSTGVQDLDGCVAEVGVYNGGSALLLCRLNPAAEIFIFDTFHGMPATSEFDNFHNKGDFGDASEQHVRDLLKDYPNCKIYGGEFPSQTGLHIKRRKFKLVHLDVDIYESYKNSLKFFYPRMVAGGVVIMDDYASGYCLGAKKAVDEFMIGRPEKLLSGLERQAYFVKK